MKAELISEIGIFYSMNGNVCCPLSDIDIYDDDEGCGESHKTLSLMKDDNDVLCVEVDNGDLIPLTELNESELECICEELEIEY